MNLSDASRLPGLQRRTLLLGAASVLSGAAQAQTSSYPNRPIQLIV
eukprot:gene30949-53178_t